ncbi:MAG: sialidase family protein [Actinomycetota bacterium]
MSSRIRTLVVVLAVLSVAVLVSVVITRERPVASPSRALHPSESDEEQGGESHTLDDEEREAFERTRARMEAVDAAREAGTNGRTGPARPIPNPGWTTERAWSVRADDWEPAIAADPAAPFVYALSTRYTGPARCPSCPIPSIVLRVSADGGRTWGRDRFLCVCAEIDRGQYDPQIVVDAQGTVYAAWLEGFQPGVSISRSTDHGRTWSTPVSMPTAWSDKPWLAVSPSGQDVYVAYNGPSRGDSFVGVSHDGGATFVARKVTEQNRYFFAGGGWVSADGQHIVFAESDFDQRSAAQIHSDVVVSDDGGATWQVVRVATGGQQPDCTSEGCYDGFYGPTPTVTGDVNGDLMLVYAANDADRAPQQVFATSSSDGGLTWADPTPLSPPGSDAIFPAAVSGGPGDFRVWWMDTRTGRWNVWYSRTTDGGAIWSDAIRLSNARGGTAYKRPNGFLEAYGDYGEIDVTNEGKIVAIWGEGASYAGPGGVWFVRER